MNGRMFCNLICALAMGPAACLAVPVQVLTNQGTGQDGMVYSNPSVPFALSPAYPVIGTGKTTGGASDLVSLIQFDLTSTGLTSSQVASATMRLLTSTSVDLHTSNNDVDASHVINVGISPITSAWNRTAVTWSTKPTHGAQETSFNVNAVGQYFTVDVTDLVKDWLDTPASNFGMWLEATNIIPGDTSGYYALAFRSGFLASPPFGPGGPQSDGPLLTITPVPEPATAVLAACAAVVLGSGFVARRRTRRRRCVT